MHGSAAELEHAELGVVLIFEFLIVSLDLKLFKRKKKNPNSTIVYPHGSDPTLPAVQREMGVAVTNVDTDRKQSERKAGKHTSRHSVHTNIPVIALLPKKMIINAFPWLMKVNFQLLFPFKHSCVCIQVTVKRSVRANLPPFLFHPLRNRSEVVHVVYPCCNSYPTFVE